jgi:hypothetical protein
VAARKADGAPRLSLRALNRATLARQMLLSKEREETSVAHAVQRLVGLQAQWPKPPFVGLWSRVAGFTREDLVRLLDERRLVRGTMMRGTLHLVTAEDFRALRACLQPMLTQGMQSILKGRTAGFDIDRVVTAARALLDEEPRTFTELRARLVLRFPEGDERAMGFAVRTHLPLVQVPAGGSAWAFPADAAFAVAESWIGAPLAKDEGPAALVRRYLAAFGPAIVADVQAWSGLKALRGVVDALRPELDILQDERGRELFDLRGAPRPPEDAPAPPRFLPEYDNLIVSREGARFVADAHRPSVFLSALRVRATFLVDGFVAGTWKITRARAKATLDVEPFATLPVAARRALGDEAARLVRFQEPDATEHDVRFAKP